MPSRALGLVALILLATGCTWSGPVRSLTVAANNPSEIERGLDGTVVMRSHRTHFVSVLSRGDRFSSDTLTVPSLYVIVTNGGKDNLTFNPRDIAAYAGDRRVALLHPPALQERLDHEQAAAGSKVGFPIGMRDASQPAKVRHGHGHRDLTSPAIEPFGAPGFKVPARLLEQALQPQVIRPGEVGGGRIMLEPEDILSGLPLQIIVTVAGEKHPFLFEVQY